MLNRIRKLKEAGVVGINNRNRGYIMPRNPRHLYSRVDDKVETKRLAIAAGIAVPELYGLIHAVREAKDFARMVEGRTDFVVKPAHGSGGKGILVITERRRDMYIKGDGHALSAAEVQHHIENVLGGVYSLGGQPDQAIIEYRVKFDRVFEQSVIVVCPTFVCWCTAVYRRWPCCGCRPAVQTAAPTCIKVRWARVSIC